MTVNTGHRRSIRLPSYDYAAAGTYFVTICVQDRACALGDIKTNEFIWSDSGLMVESWWGNIARRFATVGIDAYVIMPNHLHGLLRFGWEIDGSDARRGKPPCLPSPQPAPDPSRDEGPSLPVHDEPVTLGRVVQWFKSATTADYRNGVERFGWPPYPGRRWQRNYYEHIVRNETDLTRIRAYIDGNVSRWTEDAEYREDCPGFR